MDIDLQVKIIQILHQDVINLSLLPFMLYIVQP